MHETLVSPRARAWANAAAARIGKKVERLGTQRKRKFVLVHLDGVPRAVLEEAVQKGTMPFLSSLVRSGAYYLDTAFWGSPASTPCFQAGLLYGIRHPNLPAYHWYERELGRVVRMNVPSDAAAIEARLGARPGESLLEGGGTSYLSLFQAEATNLLNMTSLATPGSMAKRLLSDLRGIRSVSHRGVLSFLGELGRDTLGASLDAARWAEELRGDWRHEKEYLLNRFFMISLGWNLALSRALIDMVRGVPSIYLVFGNFDEVAHRRGPLSEQAMAELYRADARFEELYAMARTREEPYDLYFLSDHGHVDSAPLEQRLGQRLEKYLTGPGPSMKPSPDLVRGLLNGRQLEPRSPVQYREEPVVIEAGNFAHVYLTRSKEPLEAKELLAVHSEVLARVAALRDVGICALRRGTSAVAIIRGGVYGPEELDRAPLSSEFSRRAVADLLWELPHMKTAGDLVLFGDAHQAGATVGFAWEFGSHGGVTKIETESIVCGPREGPVDLSALSHSTQLYQRLSAAYRS